MSDKPETQEPYLCKTLAEQRGKPVYEAEKAALSATSAAALTEHITDMRQLAEEMALTAEGVPGMNLALSKARIARVCRAYLELSAPSSERVSTHWVGCGIEGGPRHYECLRREYRELSASPPDAERIAYLEDKLRSLHPAERRTEDGGQWVSDKEHWSAPPDGVISTIPCARCGGKCIEFTVPNDVWNTVVRRGGKEGDDEYLCEACYRVAVERFVRSATARPACKKCDYPNCFCSPDSSNNDR